MISLVSTMVVAVAIDALKAFHPLVIEGPGQRDDRDASEIAGEICTALEHRWVSQPPGKPVILLTQGDPIEDRGISQITRRVAARLGLDRALVVLDEHLDPTHSEQADRHGVVMEFTYSQMAAAIEPDVYSNLASAVDAALVQKNAARMAEGRPPLASYYREYALLQEVTKTGCKAICNNLTFVHTLPMDDIHPFSVTSFYAIGLELSLYSRDDIVTAFSSQDFERHGASLANKDQL